MHKSAEMCTKAIHFSFSSFEPIAVPGEQMTDTKGAFRAFFLTVTIRNYQQWVATACSLELEPRPLFNVHSDRIVGGAAARVLDLTRIKRTCTIVC